MRVQSVMFFHFFTGRMCKAHTCRYCLCSQADFSDRSRWNLAVRSSLSNFPLYGSGVWVYGQCTILTKFTEFMHVLSLHKSAKFGCFISINDKTINNLPRWGRFHFLAKFSMSHCPITAKLLTGSRKVCMVKWWHGPPLLSCKIWWKSNDSCQRERTKTDAFHFIFLFVRK